MVKADSEAIVIGITDEGKNQVIVTLEDGCVYVMGPAKDEDNWVLEMPEGFDVTCPHGVHRLGVREN